MKAQVVKDVVLVGAGHAHVAVLRRFGMVPLPGVRLTLVTRELDSPYSGMLPGLVAGHYAFDDAHIDAGPLARFANARLYHDSAVGLDLVRKLVICRDRPPVPYDILSLDIGSTPDAGVPGAAEHAIPVKPIDGFIARFAALTERVVERRGRARIALVGAGAGGVELLLSVERRLRAEAARRGFPENGLAFTLVSGGRDILPTFPPAVRRRFMRILAERGVAVRSGRVERVEAGALTIAGGPPVEADEILWTTQAAAAPWLRESGLPVDPDGFLRVDATLRAQGREDVFAAGDMIAFGPRALRKSGVYAVRAGVVLAGNIRRSLVGRPLRAWRPQTDALYLLTTGERRAVGTRNGLAFEGAWVWRWKDRIDRRFMRRFSDLPPMAAAPDTRSPLADRDAVGDLSHAMRCGGCGAKVGPALLSRALGRLRPLARADVVVGLDSPDDAAVVDMGGPRLAVHTVDHFRAFVDDPWLFGRIAANHALGDIYAMGAEPQTALAVVTIPYGPEAKVEADLSALMAGADAALREAGCALVGGHTGEGAELSLGFAVNGLVGRDAIVRKDGMRPGDALILTKPIGAGALLAADMRGLARARWVAAALARMTQSSRRAGEILRMHGARAATDVTGFGLLGHLLEMARASGVDATAFADRIPLLDGAADCVRRGIVSSLQPQNLRLREAIREIDVPADDPLVQLLFDPQTAGGLLASVPGPAAQACVQALREADYAEAAIVGEVSAQTDALRPIRVLRGACRA